MNLLPSIHIRLQQVQERHEEISMLLATQEIMADQNRFRELSVEYSQLGPVVTTWARWQQAGRSIEEAKGLLKNQDAEIRELANEELASATEQQQALEKQLNMLLLPKDPDDDSNIFLEMTTINQADSAISAVNRAPQGAFSLNIRGSSIIPKSHIRRKEVAPYVYY